MIRFTALPTDAVRALQRGGPDANGHPPEHAISDGKGNPCRHCLCEIPTGNEMLILAHRPFDGLHPYAETGPIFLCAQACVRGGGVQVPEILTTSPEYLIKGYSKSERIVYGTGIIVAAANLVQQAGEILRHADVEYVHVRSARNNCYQVRIDRS